MNEKIILGIEEVSVFVKKTPCRKSVNFKYD
jgi:hypothetical protein